MIDIKPVQPRDHAGSALFWFAFMATAAFCGAALGYAACRVSGVFPPRLLAWAALAAVAIVVGGMAAVLLNWLLLDRYGQLKAEVADLRRQTHAVHEMQAQAASRAEQHRRLRHDLRGALSPALLTSDRLLANTDPAVRRAGEIMVRCVEKAAALLTDPEEATPPVGS